MLNAMLFTRYESEKLGILLIDRIDDLLFMGSAVVDAYYSAW